MPESTHLHAQNGLLMTPTMTVLKPRQAAPALVVDTLQGPWSLAQQTPETFTMLVFYRGLHCPICAKYLQELDAIVSRFNESGVTVLALSSDSQERAQQAQSQWKLNNVTLGYGLSVEQAQAWGLHRSAGKGKTSIGIEEPAEFSEPALFLINPEGTLYWSQINSMPFARPHFVEILGALSFVITQDYPARGELI